MNYPCAPEAADGIRARCRQVAGRGISANYFSLSLSKTATSAWGGRSCLCLSSRWQSGRSLTNRQDPTGVSGASASFISGRRRFSPRASSNETPVRTRVSAGRQGRGVRGKRLLSGPTGSWEGQRLVPLLPACSPGQRARPWEGEGEPEHGRLPRQCELLLQGTRPGPVASCAGPRPSGPVLSHTVPFMLTNGQSTAHCSWPGGGTLCEHPPGASAPADHLLAPGSIFLRYNILTEFSCQHTSIGVRPELWPRAWDTAEEGKPAATPSVSFAQREKGLSHVGQRTQSSAREAGTLRELPAL